MKVLFINNFDSFVWNLVDYVSVFEPDTIVVDNTISIEAVRKIDPDAIVISPGPGHPAHRDDIGCCIEIIREFGDRTPILGVCLGHQTICVAYEGVVTHSNSGPMHGKTSLVMHDGKRIYRDIPDPFTAGRYHSLSAKKVPDELRVVAISEDGEIMGLRHRKHPVEGVQFHPESVLTPDGLKIIKNFLDLAR